MRMLPGLSCTRAGGDDRWNLRPGAPTPRPSGYGFEPSLLIQYGSWTPKRTVSGQISRLRCPEKVGVGTDRTLRTTLPLSSSPPTVVGVVGEHRGLILSLHHGGQT